MEYAPASKAPRGSQETSLPPLEPHRWLQSSIWFHLIEFAGSLKDESEPDIRKLTAVNEIIAKRTSKTQQMRWNRYTV
jgi:hypothetical protein